MSVFNKDSNYLYSSTATLDQWKERVQQEYPDITFYFETWNENELAEEDYDGDVFAIVRYGKFPYNKKCVGVFEQEYVNTSSEHEYCSIRLELDL